jgi:hypothetical protein
VGLRNLVGPAREACPFQHRKSSTAGLVTVGDRPPSSRSTRRQASRTAVAALGSHPKLDSLLVKLCPEDRPANGSAGARSAGRVPVNVRHLRIRRPRMTLISYGLSFLPVMSVAAACRLALPKPVPGRLVKYLPRNATETPSRAQLQ